MANNPLAIFDAANIINPQDPGNLPFEDRSFLSSLVLGDQITWIGGGEAALISITDNADNVFDEADSNQTLSSSVTFGGIDYLAGQVVTPTYLIAFNGSDGESYVLSSFNFSPNTNNEEPDALFWVGDIPPVGTVLTVTGEVNPTNTGSPAYADMAVCFAAGTQIATPKGPVPVQDLRAGDDVVTFAGVTRQVQWVGHRHVHRVALQRNPNLAPVIIAKGALGDDIPHTDLTVSRHHRVLVSSKIAHRMFGASAVLVSAHALTPLPGVRVDHEASEVTYYHILLEDHDVLVANGAPAESLYLGTQAIGALSADRLAEIRTVMPHYFEIDAQMTPAHPLLAGQRQKGLIRRHAANRQALIQPRTGAAV